MVNTDLIEREEAPTSAPLKISADRHGVSYTLGGPVLKISLLPKPQPPRRRTLREAWSNLWETEPPVFPIRLGPGAPWPKVRRITPAFLTSILIQSSIVFFLLSVPFAAILSLLMGPPRARVHPHMVVYEFHPLNLMDYLPEIKPPGHGKAPGRGAKQGARPRLGSSHFDPRVTIVSNPPNPDNFRLTLKTENVPPDIKPLQDLKVPDLISGGLAPAPEIAKPLPPPPEKTENPTLEKPNPAPPPKPPETQVVVPQMKPLAPPAPPPPVELAMQPHDIPAPRLEVPPPPPPPPPVKNPAPPVAQAAPVPPPPTPHETTQPAAVAPAAPPSNKSETAAASATPKLGGDPRSWL